MRAPAVKPFDWNGLARFKREGRFLDGYPDDFHTFFAPRDDLHGVLVELLQSASHSIVLNMFGYDDEELDSIIRQKLDDEKVYVQMSLDRRQFSVPKEQDILSKWSNDDFGNSIAIGTSSVKSQISHLKILIVDGVYTVKGSTNWSTSGETQQDNELTLSRNAVIAAETRAVLDLNHDWMLKQMAAARAKGKPIEKPKPRAAPAKPAAKRRFTRDGKAASKR